ncbi:hypothetical protein Golax_004117 [Gossypium laxum]|uniref:Uncharacterized protein n=1 Tax=Gossypium laxum TaxID=34288 RepID=A0A7J9AHP9_9ROSI|nr:hypothetical protein [Gossypium laxum]
MNVSLDKGNSTVCMVENVDPNAGISSKIMKDGGCLLLHRKGSSTIPSDISLHGSCFGSRAILGDETHAKGGMLVPLNEVVKSSTHRLESIASDGSNLMIEEEYGNKSDGADTYPVLKVKEVGDLMTGEPAIEAPLNGDRNYNGPKVAKFLIGADRANSFLFTAIYDSPRAVKRHVLWDCLKVIDSDVSIP